MTVMKKVVSKIANINFNFIYFSRVLIYDLAIKIFNMEN